MLFRFRVKFQDVYMIYEHSFDYLDALMLMVARHAVAIFCIEKYKSAGLIPDKLEFELKDLQIWND